MLTYILLIWPCHQVKGQNRKTASKMTNLTSYSQIGYCEHEDKVDSKNEIELWNGKCSFKCSLKESSTDQVWHILYGSSRLKGLGTWGDLFMGISCSAAKVAYSGRMVKSICPCGVNCTRLIDQCVFIACVVVADTTRQGFSWRARLIDENIIDSTSTNS